MAAETQFHFLEVTVTPLAVVVTLNRTKVLNAFNLKMIAELHSVVEMQDERRLVMRGAGKAFCAGGDVVHLSRHLEDCPPFFRETYSLCYRIYARKGWSIAFMKGVTMGGGAGLSYACKSRVAMPSTMWAFPETALGSIPDAGANFILTHLTSQAVGLYLALTGERLNGADCFFLGIATHFLTDDSLQSQLETEVAECEDPMEVLERFHRVPNREDCKVLRDQGEIEEVFGGVTSVEEVVERVRRRETQWAVRTLAALDFVCPLALHVAFKALHRAKSMTYSECLDMEYDLVMQMTVARSANYQEGVQHRLVRKEKTRPSWQPANLSQVDQAEVTACLANDAGPRLLTALIRK